MKKLLIISAAVVLLAAGCNKKGNVETPTPQTQDQTPAVTTDTTTPVATGVTTKPNTIDTAPVPTQPTVKSYTMEQVTVNNSASKCWVAINGNVYDLTKWINQHPGGPDKILGICGTDATAAFTAQHSGQPQPTSTLATFKIGVLEQ